MDRKKWTPQVEITDSLLKFREKRKWQVALRRYVLEKNRSPAYAYYFGLDIEHFRKWIELQFTEGLHWDNFGSAWQFEHIIPVAYFDFSKEDDLQLCWHFVNIRVEKIEANKKGPGTVNLLGARPYFTGLYERTRYSFCLKMVDKIDSIVLANAVSEPVLEDFITGNKGNLEVIATFNRDEFNNLNLGLTPRDILLEREILNKFG